MEPDRERASQGSRSIAVRGLCAVSKTKADRLASGDSRLSIEERYTSLWLYYFYAVNQANIMVSERFLLPDDAAVMVNQLLNNMLASSLCPGHGGWGDASEGGGGGCRIKHGGPFALAQRDATGPGLPGPVAAGGAARNVHGDVDRATREVAPLDACTREPRDGTRACRRCRLLRSLVEPGGIGMGHAARARRRRHVRNAVHLRPDHAARTFFTATLELSTGAWRGTLHATSGPYYGAQGFDPSQVTVRDVGALVFTPLTQDSAKVEYGVDGTLVSKNVARQTLHFDKLQRELSGDNAARDVALSRCCCERR